MATKKISRVQPKAEKAEAPKKAEPPKQEAAPEPPAPAAIGYTNDEIVHIANVTTTGYGLGPDYAVVVHRASKLPQLGATTMAIAQTVAKDHIIIPMRSFSEAQYSLPEIRELVEA